MHTCTGTSCWKHFFFKINIFAKWFRRDAWCFYLHVQYKNGDKTNTYNYHIMLHVFTINASYRINECPLSFIVTSKSQNMNTCMCLIRLMCYYKCHHSFYANRNAIAINLVEYRFMFQHYKPTPNPPKPILTVQVRPPYFERCRVWLMAEA